MDCLIGNGVPLFAEKSKSSFEVFVKIVDILGMPPVDLMEQSDVDYCEFDSKHGQWKIRGNELPPSCEGLRRYLDSRGISSSDPDYDLFLDLVESMLSMDSSSRISPFAALDHPFLKLSN